MFFIEKLKEIFFKNKKKIIFCSVVLGIVAMFLVSSYFIYSSNKKVLKEKENIEEIAVVNKEESKIIENTKVMVDIKGEIKKPGVYEVDDYKTINDVILLAGGLTKDANTRYINLSKKVSNEMVIIIYSNDEIKEIKEKEIKTIDEVPCVCESTINDGCIFESSISNIKNINSLVNINTASATELEVLDGIGSTKSNAIVEYRNTNGLFNNIEEIKNVSGISESTYTKIKDFITTK